MREAKPKVIGKYTEPVITKLPFFDNKADKSSTDTQHQIIIVSDELTNF